MVYVTSNKWLLLKSDGTSMPTKDIYSGIVELVREERTHPRDQPRYRSREDRRVRRR